MVAFIYPYMLYNIKAFMVTIVEAITKKQKKIQELRKKEKLKMVKFLP